MKIHQAIFDLETDGLYDEVTRIHCLNIRDFDSGLSYRFRQNNKENTIQEGLRLLENADFVIGQNILHFDIPVIEKLYPWFNLQGKIRDTLVLSRVVYSDQKDKDFRLYEKGLLPGKCIGGNRLEDWGYRLGLQKGEYAEEMEEKAKALGIRDKDEITKFVWGTWNQEMDDYCDLDVTVTTALWQKIIERGLSETALQLEHKIHDIMGEQERNGWYFDVMEAELLAADLERTAEQLEKKTQEHYGFWWGPDKKMITRPLWDPSQGKTKRTKARKSTRIKTFYTNRPELGEDDEDRKVWADVVIPKRTITFKDKSKMSRTEGVPFCPIKKIEFNPSSRQHIVDRFTTVYNWEPEEFTEAKSPVVDDTILRTLSGKIPMAEELAEIFYYNKRLGQVRDGANGWLKMVKKDGRIHHYCSPVDTAMALTKDGWKFRNELKVGDLILAYDSISKTKKWTPILSFSDYSNSELIRLKNSQSFNIEVTDDHRWFVRQRTGKNRVYKEEIRRTFELNSESAIITNAPLEDVNLEGIYDKTSTIPSKYETDWIKRVLQMSTQERKAFLEGFCIADGHYSRNHWNWAQNEGNISEALLTCSFLVNSSYIHIDRTLNPNGKTLIRASLGSRNHITMKKLEKSFSRIADTWCPNTELGSWVMRQNDCITITGNCNVGGTVTGRASHVKPNLAQVPRVVVKKVLDETTGQKVSKIFKGREGDHGWDCRRLFTCPDTHIIVGSDLEGIELRCLAELLAPYDNGEYIDVVLSRDIHSYNQEAAGLDSRDKAKTFIYALVYGAGDAKLGSIVDEFAPEEEQIRLGAHLRAKFLANLKGFREVMKQIKQWARRGFVPGLDGRLVPVRSEHAALNSKLQSDAALIAKKWIINYYDDLHSLGLECGWDKDFVFLAWIHDENQSACKKGLENILKETSIKAAANAGKFFNFKIPVAAAAKVGKNWAETH